MLKFTRKMGVAASAAVLLAGGLALGAAPSAQAAPLVGPTGCSAYASGHNAVGWCTGGNGTWYVKTYCKGSGAPDGPYTGDQGYRKLSTEKASTKSCGTETPFDMTVVNIHA